jgi:hypothetical protein
VARWNGHMDSSASPGREKTMGVSGVILCDRYKGGIGVPEEQCLGWISTPTAPTPQVMRR